MVPFRLDAIPGVPLHEQLAFAAKKAIVSGRLRPGDQFPSVRVLSRELKLHANTAQKAITQLRLEGFLGVRPGIGTVVAHPPVAARSQRSSILRPEIDQLTVEALKLGVTLDEFQEMVSLSWKRLQRPEVVTT